MLHLHSGDGARAQQHRRATGAVDDGGLDAHFARATVQNRQGLAKHGVKSGKFTVHMGGGGGAHAAEPVRAGRCNAPHHSVPVLRFAQRCQHCLRHRMRGAAQPDADLPASSRGGHTIASRHDQGQRPRPEGRHELLCKRWHPFSKVRHAAHAAVEAGQVHDQRVVGGAAFGGEDFGHRAGVVRIRAQPVHRLGWQANQVTSPYGICASSYRIRSKLDTVRKHIGRKNHRAAP